MIAIVGIDYDEFDVTSYRGCTLSLGEGSKFTYFTGDVNNDLDIVYLLANMLSRRVCNLSSVDHFYMDMD